MKSPKESITDKLKSKHVNRTGMALSPKHSKEMMETPAMTEPSSMGDETGIAEVRGAYTKDAEPIGSMPPPPTMKGAAKTAMKAIQGEHATVLLDKIGERLAFERTGTRLYEALLARFGDMKPKVSDGLTRARLEQILEEEREHFTMLHEVMKEMGGDPTAVTPSADVSGVLSMGVPQVLLDARMSFNQCLEAILLAELADHDGWSMLIELAEAFGQDELTERFAEALREEGEHLRDVRAWVKAGTLDQAGVASKGDKKKATTHAHR
jgi:rubrerythrin